MALMTRLDDLTNHGLGGNGGSGGGIGRHMLIYRSHQGNSTSTNPKITLMYYQNIFAGANFHNIQVVNIATGEVVTKAPVISGDDTIILETKDGRPLLYGETYQVNIPENAIKDKRGTHLLGTYMYNFKVVSDNQVVTLITPDMNGEDISEMLKDLVGSDNTIDNIVIVLPSGTIDVGDSPIIYPDGTIFIGNGSKITSSSTKIDVLLVPMITGSSKLTLKDVVVEGSVQGEWLDLDNTIIVNRLTTSNTRYSTPVDSYIDIKDCTIGDLNIENYRGPVKVTSSTIRTGDFKTRHISGTKCVFTGTAFIHDVVATDYDHFVVECDEFQVSASQIYEIGFDVSGVENGTKFIYVSMLGSEWANPFITKNNYFRDGEEIPYTSTSIDILGCNIKYDELDDTAALEIIGESIPNIRVEDSTIAGATNLCIYRKKNLNQYYNVEYPLLKVLGNTFNCTGAVIDAEKTVYQKIRIMMSGNVIVGNLSLPNNHFTGMVTANITDSTTIVARNDLVFNDNTIVKG